MTTFKIPASSSDEMGTENEMYVKSDKPLIDPYTLGVTCGKGTMYPETCAILVKIKKAQSINRPSRRISETGRNYYERIERGQLDQGRL